MFTPMSVLTPAKIPTPKRVFLPALWLLASLSLGAPSARAWIYDYTFGLHDFWVPAEQSHTLGVNTTFSVQHRWPSGVGLDFNFDLFLDHDQDKLDPDHIPLWFISSTTFQREIRTFSANSSLSWTMELIGKRNTVSAVEKQFKIFPGLRWRHQQSNWDSGLQAAVGYYHLEIDDDVPVKRGYTRDDVADGAPALTLRAETRRKTGESSALHAALQGWFDDSGWREVQVKAEWTHQVSRGRLCVISAEYTNYNLDPYQRPPSGNVPAPRILPWHEDILLKISLQRAW
jgi:hypothetical protein